MDIFCNLEPCDGGCRCNDCGQFYPVDPSGVRFACRAKAHNRPTAPDTRAPHKGPGTELKATLASIGIVEQPGCDCASKMIQMNAWGVDGCREHFDEIVGWLRESEARLGWADKLKAAALAASTGLALRVNWTDPFPGLVELAISRAEEKLLTAP